eukprot:jgi/Mesvir1/2044/Mv14787-RA.1
MTAAQDSPQLQRANRGIREDPVIEGALGGAAAVIEVGINQPTVAIKNAMQERRPIPLNPLHLYRGVLVNALSIAPITATQFAMNRFLEKCHRRATEAVTGTPHIGPPSSSAQVMLATLAGTTSAFVSTPAECVMIQQQRLGTSIVGQCRNMLQGSGFKTFYYGFAPTCMRESVYTGCYLGISPVLKQRFIHSDNVTFQENPRLASLLASCCAGVFGAVVSHPADTIKTRMQADLREDSVYRTVRGTAATMYAENGMATLYKGFLPRCFRVTTAAIILVEAADILAPVAERLLAAA